MRSALMDALTGHSARRQAEEWERLQWRSDRTQLLEANRYAFFRTLRIVARPGALVPYTDMELVEGLARLEARIHELEESSKRVFTLADAREYDRRLRILEGKSADEEDS